MTIHWKALEEHFLRVTITSNIFGGNAFSEFFSKKPQSIKSYSDVFTSTGLGLSGAY
jgi:hypothetical protein